MLNPKRTTFPLVGFETGDEAISATKKLVDPFGKLALAHEREALTQRKICLKEIEMRTKANKTKHPHLHP